MTTGVGRVVATTLAAAVAAVLWLALFYGLGPGVAVNFETAPPRLLTGMYPIEREPVSGRTFAWTSDRVTLRLPGIDRRVEWRLALRVRGARVQPGDNPGLTVLADGVVLDTRPTSTDYTDFEIAIPSRADRRGLAITLLPSTTFIPGPSDPRTLGVVIEALRLSPSGLVVPPRTAFAGAALAAAALGGGVAALGMTAGAAIGGAVLIGAGVSSTIARGFAPYTDFPSTAARLGLAIALCLVAGGALVRAWTGVPLRRTARFAAAFSAAALLLKLLVLLHPDKSIGDALFHAHRFQDVLAGNLYFTSTAPGNYLFPYAPGLYVFASAFASVVSRGVPDMALLRVITAAADTLVALLLYRAVVSSRGDRLGAAMTVAIYQLTPLSFEILSVGNLTNAFAQSVSVVALALMADRSVRLDRWWLGVLFALVLSAAFLSHTSTFAILFVAVLATALLFVWRGRPALTSQSVALLVCLGIAVVLATTTYYAHFIETYRTELARIGVETAAVAPDAGGRGISARLGAVPRYLWLYFGVPGLALAAWGTGAFWQRGPDRLTFATAGWALACAAFLALGVLTPVDMRYYLASIPVVAIASGLGASTGWSQGGWARSAAAGLLAWAALDGLWGWWAALG